MNNYNNFGRDNLQLNRRNNTVNTRQSSFNGNNFSPRGNSGFHMLNDRLHASGANSPMREQNASVGMNDFNRIQMQNFGAGNSNFMNLQGNKNTLNNNQGFANGDGSSMNNRNMPLEEDMGMGSNGFARGTIQSRVSRDFGTSRLPSTFPSNNSLPQMLRQTNEVSTNLRNVFGSNSYSDSMEDQNNMGPFSNNPNKNNFFYARDAHGKQDFVQALSAQRFAPSANNFMLNRSQEEEEMNFMARNRNNVNHGYSNLGSMNDRNNNRQEESGNFGGSRSNNGGSRTNNSGGFYRQSNSDAFLNNNKQNIDNQGYSSNQNRFNNPQNNFNNANQGFNNNQEGFSNNSNLTNSARYGNTVQNRSMDNNINGGNFLNRYANPTPAGNSYNYQAGGQNNYSYANNRQQVQQNNSAQQGNEFDWLNDPVNQSGEESREYVSYSSGDYAKKYDDFEKAQLASMYGKKASSGAKSNSRSKNRDFEEYEDDEDDEDDNNNKKSKGSSFLSLFKTGKKKKRSDDLSFFDEEEDEEDNRSTRKARRQYFDDEEDIDDDVDSAPRRSRREEDDDFDEDEFGDIFGSKFYPKVKKNNKNDDFDEDEEDDFDDVFGMKSKVKSKAKKQRRNDDFDEDEEDDFDDVFGMKSKVKSKAKKRHRNDDFDEDEEDDFDDIFGVKSKPKLKTRKHRKNDDDDEDEYDFDSLFGKSKGKRR